MQLRGSVAGQSHGGICATAHTQTLSDKCSPSPSNRRPRRAPGKDDGLSREKTDSSYMASQRQTGEQVPYRYFMSVNTDVTS